MQARHPAPWWMDMKKGTEQNIIKRKLNPYYLMALMALGFLRGLNEGDWGRYVLPFSLLSLLSLLVLIPARRGDNSSVLHPLHPKRKVCLWFLSFLVFLGFIYTDSPQWAWVACLALLSNFALDKKDPSISKKTVAGRVFFLAVICSVAYMKFNCCALVILIGAVALIPHLWDPSTDFRRARVQFRELFPIFSLLVAAILIPVGGMVWFMTAAMRNERAAVRQQLFDLHKGQITTAQKRMKEEAERLKERLAGYAELPAPQRFDLLVREQFADTILIVCETGKHVTYPRFSDYAVEAPASREALELREAIRGLIRDQKWAEARTLLDRFAADEELGNARDRSGWRILPALQLLYVQSNPDADGAVEMLREEVLDYSEKMPSARRLFYLQALSRLGVDVEPWLGAESVAAETENYAMTLPKFLDSDGLVLLENSDLWVIPNAEENAFAVFREASLVSHLQEVVDASVAVKGIRLVLERKTERAEGKSKLTGNVLFGDDWNLRLYEEADNLLSHKAARHITRYLWTGFAVVGLMGIVSGLLIRSLLSQQRLTRLKNDFVATVTHELKTPLASTRLFVDTLLEGRCRDEQQQREYLELIARENKRLSRLIDNFLTFSRMERNKKSFDFEDVAPSDIARAAVETVHENYEQCGCRLSVHVDEALPALVADHDSMVQVLLNLLDNACKYSDGDKRIELRVFKDAEAVCFEVKDNGIGMAKRELSKILDRFYQVDQSLTRKVGGAGLGLSIVNFIIDAHGGKIDIESELGKGSIFTVKIPLNGDHHGE